MYLLKYFLYQIKKQEIVTDFSDGQRGKVFHDDKVVLPGRLVSNFTFS